MTPVHSRQGVGEALELLTGRCAAIDKHYERFPDSLDRTMEDTAKAIRLILSALSSQAAMARALETASASMQGECESNHRISLNTIDTALSTYRQTKEDTA